MEFLFECLTWHLTNENRKQVRYRVALLISCSFNSGLTVENTYCHSFIILNRVSAVSAADWQFQTHIKLLFFMSEDLFQWWKFLSCPQVYKVNYINAYSQLCCNNVSSQSCHTSQCSLYISTNVSRSCSVIFSERTINKWLLIINN